MPGSGERKIVSRLRLLPAVRAGELQSNEAWMRKAVRVEQSDDRPESLDAMFRPGRAGWRMSCHQDHLEPRAIQGRRRAKSAAQNLKGCSEETGRSVGTHVPMGKHGTLKTRHDAVAVSPILRTLLTR
jgi:hypothetical protein